MSSNETPTIDTIVQYSNMKQIANSELGITQEYNKENRDKLWDSTKGKADFKEKQFGDKKTYEDGISGKTLHKNQSAAQKKYHMKNADGENVSTKWAEHSAETDHINALKDVHNIAKHNPFLSDDDFKEIMNSEENYRLLSKSTNTKKGDKSDWEIILDKDSELDKSGKVQMAKEKVKSDVVLQGKFAARTAKNMGGEFVTGAKDTLVDSAIPLTAEAVRKMVKVAQGEESFTDAAKDMGKITVDVAVTGGTNKLLVDVVSSQLANSKNVVLKEIAASNEVAQIIAVAAIVKDSAVKYINGEIDGKEFIEEVGEKGTTMVAGMIGGQVGKEIGAIIGATLGTAVVPGAGTVAGYVVGEVIGEVLGVLITTVACSAIVSVYNTSKHLDDYKLKENQIKKLERAAVEEIGRQRQVFQDIVARENKKWDIEIQEGFEMMITKACDMDVAGVTNGLDKILGLFGKHVEFSSIEEYEAQLVLPLKLKF